MANRPAWPLLLLALLALLAPGGCGLGDALPWRPATSTVGDPPPPGQKAVRVGLGGTAGYALLLQESGERRLWRMGEGFAFATQGARVVATSGQPQVLMATRIDGADPLAAPEALLEAAAPARRLVDLGTAARNPADMRFGLEISCRLAAAPGGEAAPDLLAVTERCRGAAPIGGFTNRFWIRRADGAVLRSEQWIGPGLPALRLEVPE